VNSVFFSNRYHAASFANACSPVGSTAADRTFTWLESNLSRARQAREKVWLMLHIPPGIDGYASMMRYRSLSKAAGLSAEDRCRQAIVSMWKPVYSARFERLMSGYPGTIAATFAGHNHTDDFRVIAAQSDQFVLIDPPVSPIYGQNPSFRVVTFTGDGGLADQSTYYLTNLEAARSDFAGTWKKEYSFDEKWESPRLDATSLKTVDDRIKSEPQARAQWLTLLNISSAHDPVPMNGVETLDCAIAALDPGTYQACYCPVGLH
jgi:sphingomyelin phosphodiesterase acid-like 3